MNSHERAPFVFRIGVLPDSSPPRRHSRTFLDADAFPDRIRERGIPHSRPCPWWTGSARCGSSTEEFLERRRQEPGRFLGNEMSTRKRARPEILGPLVPDRGRVCELRFLIAGDEQDRTFDAMACPPVGTGSASSPRYDG